MIISELIKEFQEIQKEKGDIHVWVNHWGIYNNDNEILNIKYMD